MIDQYFLAGVSLVGTGCNVLGALYLAYDLLGGSHGPLRTLTRAVTYSVLFVAGYALALGPVYGLVAGIGLGLVLAVEFWRLGQIRATAQPQAKWEPLAFGFFRGLVQGLAAALTFGINFGVIFGLLGAIGLVLVYALGFSVAVEYAPEAQPHLTQHKALASIARGIVIGIAGAIAGVWTREGAGAFLFGLEVGLVVGFVSAFVATFSPFVEYWADHLPERRLGALGIGLVIFGFLLESVQYWVVLLNIPVR